MYWVFILFKLEYHNTFYNYEVEIGRVSESILNFHRHKWKTVSENNIYHGGNLYLSHSEAREHEDLEEIFN